MLDTIDRLESEVRGYVRSYPTVFDTSVNATQTNSDGTQFIDFFAGAGTLNYGHNNPRVKEALLEYIQRDGVQHGLDTATSAKVKFLNTFEEVILKPREMDYKVQFAGPTGTNSVEAAIKLARKVTQRSHVVAFTNAYHGHSLGSLALTGNQYYHDEHYGSHNNVTHLPFDGYLGDYDTSEILERMLADGSSGLPKPAAVILETVQGEGGINVCSFKWLQRIAEICKQHGILLIIDDIQVGNGRTGTFFSFEPAGIEPDMICLSKSIGGGLPMSLVLIQREHDQWQPGQHTGTFRGNNLAFVAGEAVLHYWRDNGDELNIDRKGVIVRETLETIAKEFGQQDWEVRGRGMVWGIDVKDGELTGKIIKDCFAKNLIIEAAGSEDQVIKFLAPLTISFDDLNRGLEIVRSAFRDVLGGKTEDGKSDELTGIVIESGDTTNPTEVGV